MARVALEIGRVIIFIACLRAMIAQEQPSESQQSQYSKAVCHFISTFKVEPCQDTREGHNQALCQGFHGYHDRRRCPYRQEGFLYYPQQCQLTSLGMFCSNDFCFGCHNAYEMNYHPFFFKAQICQLGINCPLGLFCYKIHNETDLPYILCAQFFRFDLKTFKTERCHQKHQNTNEYCTCRFYHNDSDRRRNPCEYAYCHSMCPNMCKKKECQFSHNKIEQLYHPTRYKSKYCQKRQEGRVRNCHYGEVCSFAHSEDELRILLLHKLPKDQNFDKYYYKTVWCPDIDQHDRQSCPYAHNYQDFRRNPLEHEYSYEDCPYWVKGEIKNYEEGRCPHMMKCTMSHGWLEGKFHPKNPHYYQKAAQSLPKSQPHLKAMTNLQGREASINRSSNPEVTQSHQKSRKSKNKERPYLRPKIIKPPIIHNGSPTNRVRWDPDAFEDPRGWDSERITATLGKQLKDFQAYNKSPFTNSLQSLLSSRKLSQKLTEANVTHEKLVSLSDKQIEEWGLLAQHEKEDLKHCLEKYRNDHGLNEGQIHYSCSMSQFFDRYMLCETMNKLTKKKVNQKRLIQMGHHGIQKLSYLNRSEKSRLRTAVSHYQSQKAFKDINCSIRKEVEEGVT